MKRFLLVMLTLAACGAPAGPNTRTSERDTAADEEAPEISHEYDRSPRTFGQPVYLQAVITDDSDLEDVFLVFQRETDGEKWTSLRMALLTDDLFEGIIPGGEVSSGGVRYYMRASDDIGNEACLPDGCSAEAWHFPVVPGN